MPVIETIKSSDGKTNLFPLFLHSFPTADAFYPARLVSAQPGRSSGPAPAQLTTPLKIARKAARFL